MEKQAQTSHDGEARPRLMDGFPPATYDDWRAVVERDLKGAPFEKKLVTRTPEGIEIQPMYLRADGEKLAHLDTLPASGLNLRSSRASGYRAEAWDVAQSLPGARAAQVNRELRDALMRGQTAVNVKLDRSTRRGCNPGCKCTGREGVSLAHLKDWNALLNEVVLEAVPVSFNATLSAPAIAGQFYTYAKTREVELSQLKGSFGFDPLGALAESGSFKGEWQTTAKALASLAQYNVANAPGMAAADASGMPYHEAGASAVQELAFALAAAVEYMRALTAAGMEPDEAASQIRLVLGVGPTLFMEIAKFRAARVVWSRALKAFGAEKATPLIHARTGFYNKTKTDPYVNMLRTSTEAFSAVVGGCDSMEVGGFDEIIRQPDTFSRRIARNTHTILREECNLDRVIDPAGGSWYIETLTSELAKLAWEQFQQVEGKGGMLKSLQEGYPQEEVAKTAAWRTKRLNSRASVLVGLNMYANVSETPLEQPETDAEALRSEIVAELEAFRKSDAYCVEDSQLKTVSGSFDAMLEAAASGATVGELCEALYGDARVETTPLEQQRLAEPYEMLRQRADAHLEKTGSRPKIFLANMGSLVQHKLRADFIRGFFECGGFDVEYPDGFADADAAAEAATASGARVVVICSTDATYPELVPAVTQAIKGKDAGMRVLLAGHPGDHADAYKQAGLDDFIFVKSDHYNTLKDNLAFSGVSEQ